MVLVRRTLAFRWILPVAELILSFAFMWPGRHEVLGEARDAIKLAWTRESPGPNLDDHFLLVIPEGIAASELQFENIERRTWIPQVLNLPSGFVQLPYVIFSSSKDEWVPPGFELMTWRAVTWPLLGVIFWWSAGRGIEAVLSAQAREIKPALSWAEIILAIFILVFTALTAIALAANSHPERDPEFPTRLWVCASVIWFLLAGSLITAKVLQWQIAKHNEPVPPA